MVNKAYKFTLNVFKNFTLYILYRDSYKFTPHPIEKYTHFNNPPHSHSIYRYTDENIRIKAHSTNESLLVQHRYQISSSFWLWNGATKCSSI